MSEATLPKDYVLSDYIAHIVHDGARSRGAPLEWRIIADSRDPPSKLLARPHLSGSGEPLPLVLLADKLSSLRRLLPPKLRKLPRSVAEDPAIVEIWI